MPHMLAAEHMGYVSATRYGTARNQATINAALAAIGASVTFLVLDFTGDGIWTITSNTTIPYLYVPAGVTVNVATGVTLGTGLIIAHQSTWKTGPGTINKSAVATPMEISNLACTSYLQSSSQGGTIWEVNNGAASPAAVTAYMNQGGNATGLQVSRNIGVANSCWQINTINSGSLHIVRPGGNPMMVINNNGVMLGANVEPSAYMLQLGTGEAAKVAGTTWVVTSDGRLKDVQGTFDQGLAALLALPYPVRFRFNGKAGTPVDGKEYVGMIAQDVQPVAPYMITTYQAKLEPEDPEPTAIFAMDSSPMIFAVINALRELDTRVKVIEALATGQTPRLDALESVAHTHTGSGAAVGDEPFVPGQARAAQGEEEKPARRRHRRAS